MTLSMGFAHLCHLYCYYYNCNLSVLNDNYKNFSQSKTFTFLLGRFSCQHFLFITCHGNLKKTWYTLVIFAALTKGFDNGIRLHPASCFCKTTDIKIFAVLPNWILALQRLYLIVLQHKPIWSLSLTTWNPSINGFSQDLFCTTAIKMFPKARKTFIVIV